MGTNATAGLHEREGLKDKEGLDNELDVLVTEGAGEQEEQTVRIPVFW